MADLLTDGIKWERASFSLVRQQETTRTANALQVRDLASPVWRAEFGSIAMSRDEAEARMAKFLSLGGALRTLLVHTYQRHRPVAILSGLSNTKVQAIGSNNDKLSLSGLPAGARISAGDYISIAVPNEGRELVQAVESKSADGNGHTGLFRVSPHLRSSVTVGRQVNLVNPRMEARIEPGSLAMTDMDTLISKISFTALQVVR